MVSSSFGLHELQVGEAAILVEVEIRSNESLKRRLDDLGFIPGSQIEVLHEAPWFRDPIVVKVNGMRLAIRRSEASRIRVRK
jgi:ferrous iron transport protein A